MLSSGSAALVQSADWQGFYAGAHIGYAFGDADIQPRPDDGAADNNFWCNSVCSSEDADPEGAIGGFQAGYWWKGNNDIYFGIDGQISWANDADDSVQSPEFTEDTWVSEIDTIALLQARVGWARDQWLLYAQGGYAGVDDTAKAKNTFGQRASDDKWHDGWTIGAGALYRYNDNLAFGAEYSYIDAGDADYNWGANGNEKGNVDLKAHVVKFTINYFFK